VRYLGSGLSADVYAFSDTLVLRTYRDGGDVTAEAAVMRHVAEHGYPVPAVRGAGGRDMWLERLDGPTMLTSVTDNDLDLDEAAAILADLHHRLHRIPGSIVHRDLHPANVMMTSRGPVVIDWRNAGTGTAGFDNALTAVILGQVSLDPAAPPEFRAMAGAFLRAFLRAVGPLSELDGAVAYRRADRNMGDQLDRIAAAARLIVASTA
jgi:Ser/Thr protein kinase RdoA (MazF antagonist)